MKTIGWTITVVSGLLAVGSVGLACSNLGWAVMLTFPAGLGLSTGIYFLICSSTGCETWEDWTKEWRDD